MSYETYNSSTYESRIMKEVMTIISVIIIGICILAYYINNNFGRSDDINSDNNTVFESESSTSVGTNMEDLKTSENMEAVIEDKSFSIGRIEQSAYSVDVLASNSTSAVAADIVRYSGNIATENQEDWYSFTAPYEGRYRIDITGIQNGTNVRLYLYDDLGNVVASDTYCINKDGITGKGLEAGKIYSIKVKQGNGYTSYSLAIGMQKAPIDLTG